MEGTVNTKEESRKTTARTIWSKLEDSSLLEVIKKHESENWVAIATELAKMLPDCHKSAKQCRERYRNYLNPGLMSRRWTKEEKSLLLILHYSFGTQWGHVSSFYQGRSDVSLKNLFYSFIRKVLSAIRSSGPVALKPQRLLRVLYLLDLIQFKYLPLMLSDKETPDKRNHKSIINMIRKKEINEDQVSKFKQDIIAFNSTSLPCSLTLHLQSAGTPSEKVTELDACIKRFNSNSMAKIVSVTLVFPQSTSATVVASPTPQSECKAQPLLPPLPVLFPRPQVMLPAYQPQFYTFPTPFTFTAPWSPYYYKVAK